MARLGFGGVPKHILGGVRHIADTLANLNTKVSNATLVDSPVSATREYWSTVHRATDMDDKGGRIDAAAETVAMMLLIPQDFNSLTALEIILIPWETAASMHFDITTYYSAYNGGEAWSIHTEADTARDIGATSSQQHFAHDISDLVDVAALAAGDFLFVYVAYNDTDVDSNAFLRGIRLKYT